MKTARLLRIFVGLATMAGLLLSGCAPTAATPTQAPSAQSTAAPSGGTTPEAAPTEYVIGMSFPLTGDLASYGDAAAKAAKMAEEEINASGGINGVPIKVDIQDDRCDGEGGLTVLNKLKAEGVPVVTGFFCSSEVLNVCARYNELQVVQYVDGSNPKIWSGACGDYTFGTWGNDADQGKAQANFVLNVLKAKEVGMVYTNNDYGLGLHDSFKAAFEAAGGTLVIDLPVQQQGTDFRTEVARLKDAAPAVTMFEMYGPTGAVFLRQSKELGVVTQFVGDVNWASLETLKLEPDGADGIIAPTETPDTPEYHAFFDAFVKKYGTDPFYGSNHQYDQIYLAAKAIKMGGYTADGIKGVTMQAASDFVGASGPKKMGPDRNAKYFFTWVQYKGGQTVPYSQ